MQHALIACAMTLMSVLPAAARELTVLVQRGADSTQLYLSAPAEDLFAMTSTPVDIVPGGGGAVDTTTFIDGTWAIGDALLVRSDAEVGTEPAGFEAMSFMLHGAAENLPLNTPLDALMAIELCNVVEPGETQDWNTLIAYAGYFSAVPSNGAAITLTLPTDEAVSVRIIDAEGNSQRNWTTTLVPGEALRIDPAATRSASFWPYGILAALAAAGLAGVLRVLRRRRG